MHTRGRPWGSWGPNKGPKNRVLYHLGLFPCLFGAMPSMAGPWAGCKGILVPQGRVGEAYEYMGVPLGHMGPPYGAQKQGFGPFGPISAPFRRPAGQGGSLGGV